MCVCVRVGLWGGSLSAVGQARPLGLARVGAFVCDNNSVRGAHDLLLVGRAIPHPSRAGVLTTVSVREGVAALLKRGGRRGDARGDEDESSGDGSETHFWRLLLKW